MSSKSQPIGAALYARVSSDRQDVDLSVAAQLRALREFAERNGYAVVREYIDEAESGRVADRPHFRKMLDEAALPDAPFQEILVWKFSRFTSWIPPHAQGYTLAGDVFPDIGLGSPARAGIDPESSPLGDPTLWRFVAVLRILQVKLNRNLAHNSQRPDPIR